MPIISALLTARSRKKAQKKTQEANEIERRRRAISNVLIRRRALSALRTRQASITATAVGLGLEGGSAARNTAGNIETQATAAIGSQAQLSDLDIRRNELQEAADSRNRQADRFKAAGALATRAVTAFASGGASEAARLASGQSEIDFTNLTQ